MSEFSFSSTCNKKNNNEFSFHLIYHFINLLCFSIFSHPLYFSYFLFFSPYLFRLFSFLSPLFITTTLLLLVALLTFSPKNLVHEKGITSSEFSDSNLCLLFSVYQAFIEWLVSKGDDGKDEEIGYHDEFEAYLVMFLSSIFEVLEPKSEEYGSESEEFEASEADFSVEGREDFGSIKEPNVVNSDESPIEKVVDKVEATRPIAEVKSLESLFQEKENAGFEDMSGQKEVKELVKLLDLEFDGVEESKDKFLLTSGSKVMGHREMDAKVSINSDGAYSPSQRRVATMPEKIVSEQYLWGYPVKDEEYDKSQILEGNIGSPKSSWGCYSGKVIMGNNNQAFCNSSLGSFGSMRVEKEWRRTLACKLFEERHNIGDGGEGMDMLWETYNETESNNKVLLQKSNTKKKGKKLSEVEYYTEDDDEEDMEDKLCCLQALKFSAGKVNLGMGRPNFLKISKALKGIGWLHHVNKHSRKAKH